MLRDTETIILHSDVCYAVPSYPGMWFCSHLTVYQSYIYMHLPTHNLFPYTCFV